MGNLSVSCVLLLENHVHIWKGRLNALKEIPKARSMLSERECIQADRFLFDRHRNRFILAHALLRQVLSFYIGLPPHNINFDIGPYGKPALALSQNKDLIQFNLSHSEDLALIALRKRSPVGIDLEYWRTRNWMGIAQHAFSKLEYAALEKVETEKQKESFFHIWVQKEAFIKALGLGFHYPLENFSVTALPPARLLNASGEVPEQWMLLSFDPDKEATAAIATRTPCTTTTYYDFEWSETRS